jgi:hypothetical protein
MTSKPIVSTFLFSVALTITACGGDDDGGTDACVGHACTQGGAAVTDPEGGSIIFEHMTFDTQAAMVFKLPTGVNTATRVMAYFMSAQTPELNPLPMAGKCNNLVATMGWPLYVGTPHTDVDVGTLTITGKNAAGTDVSIDVPKAPTTEKTDQIGRPHDIFYQVVKPNAADNLKPDSFYDVKFGGSATVPAFTFKDAIYLAAGYELSAPGLEDNGPLVPGTDFTVHWTAENSANKPPATQLVAANILGVTWLLDVTGSPTHMCVGLASDGTFTIPGVAITEYKAIAAARGLDTGHAVMLRNAIAHQVVKLPLTAASTSKRRIDMISLKCYVQVMDVQ